MKKKTIKTLFIMISTVILLASCETYQNASSSGLPQGTPVPDKIGFVTSPYSPYAGYVDVRGVPPHTIVNCPYSGRPFEVPSYGTKDNYVAELNELRSEKARLKNLIAQSGESNNTADQNRQSSKKLASKPSNFYEEIDRINSIPNQRDRADSGIELIKSMTRNIDNFNKQAVESNPNLFGGKSHEEFTYDSFYQQARDSGLPPSEAKIEATRNYNNYRRFIDQ